MLGGCTTFARSLHTACTPLAVSAATGEGKHQGWSEENRKQLEQRRQAAAQRVKHAIWVGWPR